MKSTRPAWKGIVLAGLLTTGLALGANAASAGECPADKRVAVGQGQKPGPTAPKDVTDKVIATTDLTREALGIKDRQFRARQLEIKPGGIVPWHSHAERPANILVVSGAITEYRSTCATPITHKEGEVTSESGNLAHWWKNNTDKPTVLISADVLPPAKSADGMM